MPTALAFSPHLDDAAFSCGGTLAMLAGAGWRVVVATVFTASVPDPRGFALACQLDKGLSADVDYMALRREEDLVAARALGVQARWLPFREAPHRGYGSAAALFAGVREDDRVIEPLVPAFQALIQETTPDLILAPQAIGSHADHVVVVRALRSLPTTAPSLWWRDFPYTVRQASPAEPFAADFAQDAPRDIVLTPQAALAKRTACLLYGTQIGFQFGGAAGLDAKLREAGAVERFRVPAVASAAPHPAMSLMG